MKSRLYVGNLPFNVSDEELKEVFKAFGKVVSARVVLERESGRSRGFAFVEMGSSSEAEQAVEGIHGREISGRPVSVTFAREKTSQKFRH